MINQRIVSDLEKAKSVVKQLEAVLVKLNVSLEFEENTLYRRDMSSDATRESTTGVVVLFSETLSNSQTFISVLSTKSSAVESNYIQVDDIMESQLTCRKIIRSLSVKFRNSPTPLNCIINLQCVQMIPPREEEQVIVIGKLYFQDVKEIIQKYEDQFRGLGFHFVYDQGQFGGGVLTYELIQSFPESTIFEITLSQSFTEDESNMHRLLDILTE